MAEEQIGKTFQLLELFQPLYIETHYEMLNYVFIYKKQRIDT